MLLYLMVRLVGFREHRTLNAIISSMIYTALQMHHAWLILFVIGRKLQPSSIKSAYHLSLTELEVLTYAYS